MRKKIEIVNRKAKYEYAFEQEFEAGMVLLGTEVKSIKEGNANLNEAFCMFENDYSRLVIKSMYIGEYSHGNVNNHEAKRDRILLLKKSELKKMARKVTEKGMSIIPYKLYLSERGFFKILIALGRGKKTYDKRETLKDRDSKMQLDRIKKLNNLTN